MAAVPSTTTADESALVAEIGALIASGDGIESGFKTTEFWLTVLAVGVDVVGPKFGLNVSANEQMLVAGGLVIAYGAFRSWRKANGPAKLYAEIVSMFTSNKSYNASQVPIQGSTTVTTTTASGPAPGDSRVVTEVIPAPAP